MAARKAPAKAPVKTEGKARTRTPAKTPPKPPVLEWTAAALGAAATLAVLGYSAWEGFTDDTRAPRLSISAGRAEATPAGFAVPVTVRNDSYATAADVDVRAVLETRDGAVEERRARFTYVPGRGEARGGVLFRADPATGRISLEAEGWQDP